MKRLVLIIANPFLAILICNVLLARNVQAQAVPAITVTIPFAFSANSQNLAAGAYQFTLLSDWSLSIRNLNGGGEKMFMVRPVEDGSSESPGCLSFQRFEGHSYLEGVYLPGMDIHIELIRRHGTGITQVKACSSKDSTNTASRRATASKHSPA